MHHLDRFETEQDILVSIYKIVIRLVYCTVSLNISVCLRVSKLTRLSACKLGTYRHCYTNLLNTYVDIA